MRLCLLVELHHTDVYATRQAELGGSGFLDVQVLFSRFFGLFLAVVLLTGAAGALSPVVVCGHWY